MDVYVGLDWGEQHHQVHALDTDGRTRLTRPISAAYLQSVPG